MKSYRLSGVSKSRVNKVNQRILNNGYDPVEEITLPVKKQRENFLEPDYETIAHELTQKHMTQQLLWEKYYFTASQCAMNAYRLTQFKVHLKEYLRGSAFSEVIQHKPGEQAEVDWVGDPADWYDPDTGEEKKAWMFCGVLAFSGLAYAEVVSDMKLANWILVNVHMLEYFGGSLLIITLDNLKTGVIKHPKNGDAIYQKDYEAFGNHYSVILTAAKVRTPKDKSLVENFAGNCEKYILARMRNKHCYSIEEYNHEMKPILEEFNNKPYQKRGGSRRSTFEEYERNTLRALPEHPYEYHIFKQLLVMPDCFISYKYNYYSVPYKYIGKRIDARIYADRIEAWLNGVKLSEHPLAKDCKGKHLYDNKHFPPSSSNYGDWNSTNFKKWAYKIGPYAYALTEKIFELKPEQVYYQRINTILCLANTYPDERVNKACAIALENYKYPTSHAVKQILKEGIDLKTDIKEQQKKPEQSYVRGVEYYEK